MNFSHDLNEMTKFVVNYFGCDKLATVKYFNIFQYVDKGYTEAHVTVDGTEHILVMKHGGA